MNRFGTLAIFRRKANDDREMAIAAGFIKIAGAIAADGDADGRIDVAGRQAVTCCPCAVDIDLDGRLAKRREYRKVGDTLHRRQH